MSNKLTELLATFFYVGYIPLCPGSAASAVGALMAYYLCPNKFLYVLVWATVTLAGFCSGGGMENIRGRKDPGCVVIDEVSGMLLTFFMLPLTWPVLWTGYFLFRAFDMFKIYPANRFERLPGGAGIMMDDLVAGLYANLTMQLALRLAGNLSG